MIFMNKKNILLILGILLIVIPGFLLFFLDSYEDCGGCGCCTGVPVSKIFFEFNSNKVSSIIEKNKSILKDGKCEIYGCAFGIQKYYYLNFKK